jgi:ubiquinone/menaquinone biosynthesis C-methylase UbiE
VPHPRERSQELASAYFVQDREKRDEIARLELQDTMVTAGMGGVLPELADPASLRSVLDVGCGTGGWLRQTAQAYPSIEKLVGIDISSKMVDYARAHAKAEQLDDRVTFHTMDALRILEFPPATFDLVNQRFGVSWVRTWEWAKLLLEYQRVCRLGGIIRITEASVSFESNSPALTKLNAITLETFYRSGRLFRASTNGITGELAHLLRLQGLQDVQTRVHKLVHAAGTPAGQGLYEDMARLFRVGLPFFGKWTRIPDDYEEIYQQALQEMQQPDFVATGYPLTAWGTRAEGKLPLLRGLN